MENHHHSSKHSKPSWADSATMTIPSSLHLDSLILALASSMDNFTVGVSIGLQRESLPFWVNSVISVCNALGAFLASFGGAFLGETIPSLAPMLAAISFGYLAIQELRSYSREKKKGWDENKSNGGKNASNRMNNSVRHVVGLALPMTLNNLAGGVAGGAAGLPPAVSALYALFASFATMAVGHAIGKRVGRRLPFEPSILAAFLLGVLCLLTIHEAMHVQ